MTNETLILVHDSKGEVVDYRLFNAREDGSRWANEMCARGFYAVTTLASLYPQYR